MGRSATTAGALAAPRHRCRALRVALVLLMPALALPAVTLALSKTSPSDPGGAW